MAIFSFSRVLYKLGVDRMFKVANLARPPANYLYATLLPEIKKYDYTAKAGKMVVRSTMAGATAMDSSYAPVGAIDAGKFNKETAKITAYAALSEQAQRELQQMLSNISATGRNTVMGKEALNFLNKVIVQALMDRSEWLRGQALLGAIDWTYNQVKLEVDYGIPLGNFLTPRAGADAYHGATSKFWVDVRTAQALLNNQIRAIIMHPDMLDVILVNSANNIRLISQDTVNGVYKIGRYVSIAGNTQQSDDARDVIDIITYGEEGEVYDPAAVPGDPITTKVVPFHTKTKIMFIGQVVNRGYVPGQGSTDQSNILETALGYTHMAPSVEAGNIGGVVTPGRWAQLRVPDGRPWELVGEGVSNELPVIENPDRIVVATSTLS